MVLTWGLHAFLQCYFGKHSPVYVGQTSGRWSLGVKGDVCMKGGSWWLVPTSGLIQLHYRCFVGSVCHSRFRKWHWIVLKQNSFLKVDNDCLSHLTGAWKNVIKNRAKWFFPGSVAGWGLVSRLGCVEGPFCLEGRWARVLGTGRGRWWSRAEIFRGWASPASEAVRESMGKSASCCMDLVWF